MRIDASLVSEPKSWSAMGGDANFLRASEAGSQLNFIEL